MAVNGADFGSSALIIVDMQNDFLHPDGGFARSARNAPKNKIDMEFLNSSVPHVARLQKGFRDAGRTVVHVTLILKPDYTDAAFPYWRNSLRNSQDPFLWEGSWGAQIIEELTPITGEHIVIKKGYGGFHNTALDTILRNLGITTCVVCGVTTGICVSNTVRGGVEHNFRICMASDAVADPDPDLHTAELSILKRTFADIYSTDEILAKLPKSPEGQV